MTDFHDPHYSTTPDNVWKGRSDSLNNERFFQQINCYDLEQTALKDIQAATAMIGFCCDEGVQRNQGRPGAKLGPDVIRHQLGKLAVHAPLSLADIGNINCSGTQLELAQQQLSYLVDECHQLGKKTLLLGGGHEIAWPHFLGLMPHYNKIGVINFDAHFDLRPLANGGMATSGTGFLQMANACQAKKKFFSYCCLGIQPQSNTRQLFQTAEALDVVHLTASDMFNHPLPWQFAFIDNFILTHQYLYVTVCLDVFSESVAPGVSARQPTGLMPWQVSPLLQYILQTGKVVALDIAELSPPLDHDDKTARLAAYLLADILKYF